MFRSLRVRLALIDAAVLLAVLAALSIAAYNVLAAGLDRAATDELRKVADAEAREIREAEGRIVPGLLGDPDDPGRAAILIGVFDTGGEAIDTGFAPPSWLRPMPEQIDEVTVGTHTVRVITVPVEIGGTIVAQVVTARSLDGEQRILRSVRDLVWVGGGLGLLLSLVGGWWLAGRALVPVMRSYESQAAFAADASHELRSPLAYIRAGVEVLAEHDPPLGRQVLGEIDYMTGLTERMLRLARAERAGVGLEPTTFDIADACRVAAARAQQAHGVRTMLEGSTCPAVGDRVTTEAILDALLENVAQHGGGTATLRWTARDGGVTIEVADRGPGIPVEAREAVLARFGRTDASRTRATGGAGLGLAIARALAKAQGGTLALDETPGGGLTVRLGLAGVSEPRR